ncbi:MAG: D-glycerate dehydrogenase [Anaerolineaceae bacterium]|nr:D-glycerate dehydrogenase [Anaerolineaceae bacterium]
MNKPHVFVTRRMPAAGLDRVWEACEAEIWPGEMPPPYETLLEKVRGVDGLLCMLTDRIDGQLMDAAGPGLKVISQMAVGYDNIDVPAASARGIPIGHTPGVLTEATADLAFALLLAAARRLTEGVNYIQEGQWRTWDPTALLGRDLNGATLGIIGLGRIGRAVARRAAGFNMRILAYSPSLTPESAAEVNAQAVDLETLLRESDFVSVHAPLNSHTRHLMNASTLALMKPDGILINTGRGGLVDSSALVAALRSGVIGGAALDVTDPEPISLDDPLLTLPNALVVPHIGSASVWTRDQMAQMAAENLIAGVTGQPLPHRVPAG